MNILNWFKRETREHPLNRSDRLRCEHSVRVAELMQRLVCKYDLDIPVPEVGVTEVEEAYSLILEIIEAALLKEEK